MKKAIAVALMLMLCSPALAVLMFGFSTRKTRLPQGAESLRRLFLCLVTHLARWR